MSADEDESVQLRELLAENAQLREILRLLMAHFEWESAADMQEYREESYDRWNYLVGLTEKALGLGPQSRWRL